MHVVEKFQSCRAYAAKSNARAPKASKSDARHLNETSVTQRVIQRVIKDGTNQNNSTKADGKERTELGRYW